MMDGQRATAHAVGKGDMAISLADSYRTTLPALAKLNPGVDLDCLRPGQILKIPPMAVESVVVQKGFTLAQVAAACDTDVETIARLNRGSSILQHCRAGDRLLVPQSVRSLWRPSTTRTLASSSSSPSSSGAALLVPTMRVTEYPAGGGSAPSPIGSTVVAAVAAAAAAAAAGLWVARWTRSHLPESTRTRLRPRHVRAVMKRRLQQAVQEQQRQQRSPKPAAAASWLTVARAILRADWARLIVCVTAMVASVACSVMLPLALGGVFDVIQARGSVSAFMQAIAFLATTLGVPAMTSPLQVYTSAVIGERLGRRLRSRLVATLLAKDAAFYTTARKGDLMQRLTTDTAALSAAAGDFVGQRGLRSFVEVLASVTIIMTINWRLALVSLIVAPVLASITRLVTSRSASVAVELQAAAGAAMATLSEALAAVRTVVVFAQEPREHRKYDELLLKAYELSKRAAVFQGTAEGAARMSINLGTLALLSYGGHLVLAGQLTIGTLLAFNVYNLFIGSGLGSISSSLAELTKASGAVKRVFDMMPVEEEHGEQPKGGVAHNRRTEGRAEGRVCLDEVTFTYPGKTQPALRSVSVEAEPGRTVALVGPSGSGKSSVVELLLCNHAHQSGEVRLDGAAMAAWEPRWVRRQVALVSQSPALFSGTVADNIRYSNPTATMAEVEAAARAANAYDFITRLPGGFDAPVGPRGGNLSGGQRQRLAIARAVLKDAPVLVLDEATSALDAETEASVMRSLRRDGAKRTTIIIAHRLSTVKDVDSILVLDGGEVKERGTHDELLERQGLYARMVQRGGTFSVDEGPRSSRDEASRENDDATLAPS